MEKKKESKPLMSFNIFVPINITISGNPVFLEKLERYCKQKELTKSEFMNRFLSSALKKVDIKNYKELLKESGNYNLIIRSVKDSLLGYLSASNLSKFFTEKINKKWEDEGFS